MKDRGRERNASSKSPAADRSIPRGTDEQTRDETDEVVQPSDDGAVQRGADPKRDTSEP